MTSNVLFYPLQILATDMIHSQVHVDNFTKALKDFTKLTKDQNGVEREVLDLREFGTRSNIIFTKRITMKCADIGNGIKPAHLVQEGMLRVCDEFFDQTEEEERENMEISIPGFFRASLNFPATWKAFQNYYSRPLWDIFLGKSTFFICFLTTPQKKHCCYNFSLWSI